MLVLTRLALGAPPCGSGSTRGSWRAGMTNRATFPRRLSDAPDVAPVVNSPTEVLSVLSGTHLSLTLFGEHSARLYKSSSGALS